jgi:hypothetical protein
VADDRLDSQTTLISRRMEAVTRRACPAIQTLRLASECGHGTPCRRDAASLHAVELLYVGDRRAERVAIEGIAVQSLGLQRAPFAQKSLLQQAPSPACA